MALKTARAAPAVPALDLAALGTALHGLDAALPHIDRRLGQSRAPLGPVGVAGVVDAYAYLERQLAAGLYLLAIIDPQLFVEGNHRTAALFASHELMLAGLPPFVLDADVAEACFALTPELQGLSRTSPGLQLRARRVLRRLEGVIETGSRPCWVRRPAAPDPARA